MAFLRQLQIDAAGGDVHQLAVVVVREVRLVFVGKGFQRLVVRRFYPARGGDVHPFKLAIDVVFAFQPLFDDVKLQHADRAEDEVVADERLEELGRAFFAQLLQPFQERFHFQRVFQANAAEEFRREVGDAGELQFFAFGEGVADADGAVVVDADDVASDGGVDVFALGGEEGECVRDFDVARKPHLAQFHARGEGAGVDAHEGDAVAVFRVHVRLDFEDEAAEFRFFRGNGAGGGGAGARRRRVLGEAVQHFAHAEVADG